MTQEIQNIDSVEEATRWMQSDQAVWLFKHSNTCSFSASKREVFDHFIAAGNTLPAGRIVVQEYRDVSNHVAEQLGVRHETPQALLVVGGQTVWNASHTGITQQTLTAAQAEHALTE
jgi:bacillithiol system protein YtxJ